MKRLSTWGARSQVSLGDITVFEEFNSKRSKPFAFLQGNMNLVNERNITEVYDFDKHLGSGTFGLVKIGRHKATKLKRAIKQIRKAATSRKQQKMLENEMRIIQELSHTNIIQVVEFFQSDSNVYIVTDICEGGELFDEIIKRGEFSEKDAMIVTYQLFSVLSYLQTKKIVHRDIKPENILLEKTMDLKAIKIIDFGNAVEFDPDDGELMSDRVGTPFYIAPEVLGERYDHRCDVWSATVITYVLLCGVPPFGGEDNDEIFTKIKRGRYNLIEDPWPSVSREAKRFIRKVFTEGKDFKDRLDARQLMKHEFLQRRTKNKDGSKKSRLIRLTRSTRSDVGVKRTKKSVKVVANLRKFKHKLVLGQVVRRYIITQYLPKKEKEELAKIFRSWDKNNDGVLTKEEVREAITKTSPEVVKLIDIDELFKTMDEDENGYIEYQEFLMMATDAKLMTKINLEAVFDFLDKDGNGSLDIHELREAFKGVKDQEKVIKEVLQEAAIDGEDSISKEVFLKLLVVE